MIPAISVIVPVYNVEKYIEKALNSIIAQTFKDFELLLIDDGSPDNSGHICDEYAENDNRIKVFHKANGGLSDARNYGLERASGEYTIFFDPDDWVNDDCLEELYKKAKEDNADMVICDYFHNDKYRQTYATQKPTALDNRTLIKDLLYGNIFGYCVNKLIKLECYKKYNITYPVGIYGCEDQYTMCRLLLHDINVSYLPKAFYHYVYYSNSLSRHYDEKTYEMDLRIREMFTNLFDDTELHDIAYKQKTISLIARAFTFGNTIYNSVSFKKLFGLYKNIVKTSKIPLWEKKMYLMALYGYYTETKKLYNIAFDTKQLYKKIRKVLN